jgi:hypothetical protein
MWKRIVPLVGILFFILSMFFIHAYMMNRLSFTPTRMDIPKWQYNSTEFREYPEFRTIINANHLYRSLANLPSFEKYMYSELFSSHVSVVTQCSVERLHRLKWLISRWPEQISVSLYLSIPSKTREFLDTLQSNYPEFFQDRVHIHLVYNLTAGQYPLNKLRNIAWKYSRTQFIFSLDIDFIPNVDLASTLDTLQIQSKDILKNLIKNKIVLVVPAFAYHCYELDKLETCVSMRVIEGLNQRATQVRRWVHAWRPYQINYDVFYEPYFIGHRTMPRLDESFEIGNDKVAHCYEIEAAGYKWWVLHKGYVAHVPHSKEITWSLHQEGYNPDRAWEIWWKFTKRVFHQYNKFNLVCRANYRSYMPPAMDKNCPDLIT